MRHQSDGVLITMTIGILAGALAGLAGCGAGSRPAARTVSLGEFAREPDIQPVDAGPDTGAAAEDGDRAGGTGPVPPIGAGPDDDASAEDPFDDDVEFAEIDDFGFDEGVDRNIVVDSLVGQVNGRPIFAEEFFEPIEDELIATAERATGPIAFESEASKIVFKHLRQVVLSELFLAAAESNLSPEQQQGIIHWMRTVREGIISKEGGGTRAEAERHLREQEEMGVDDYVDSIRDQALTAQLWQTEIESRVIVSWRDVEREYKRRYDDFNPPATVSLSRIRIRSSKTEQVEQALELLASGLPFEEVADKVGMRDGGEWEEVQVGAGGLADVDLNEQFKQHLEGLDVGETSEPFVVGSSTWWLHVRAINRPPGRSIYDKDLQRQLVASLRARREFEEENRFINSLLENGIYDELEEMGGRLFQIARLRYGPK